MIYTSLFFACERNGKYQQQIGFKYLNNRQGKNITIYGCERKKLRLDLLKVVAAHHLDCHRCNMKPKRRPFVRKYYAARFPLVWLVIQSKTWEKTLPLSDKNLFQKRLYFVLI